MLSIDIVQLHETRFDISMFEHNIFARLTEWQAQDLKTGLATLIGIDGSSPRPLGAQIAITEDGRYIGNISSGCAEEAIIAELQTAVTENRRHVTRYGKDSPYLDVVLPCGSGLDILFTGTDVKQVTGQVSELHAARQIAFVTPQGDNGLAVSATADSDKAIAYAPDYRLHIFGAGLQLMSFAELAHVMNYQITAHSNDEASLTALAAMGIEARPMTHQTQFDSAAFDAFSAVITLFHEHEMETAILQAALDSEAHYIGALGSRKTHEQRRILLGARAAARPFEDIVGPVGLHIGATDPSEIALSILAQIVEKRRLS